MRRLAVHVLVGLVVATFIVLGVWQLGRWGDRREANAALVARARMPALGDLVGPVDELAYRRARLAGTYDTAREFLLLSRSLDGIAGHHVVTPLLIGKGRAVLVDRGWVPFAMDDPPVPEAQPPPGTVTVEGVLLPSMERGLFSPRDLIEDDAVRGVHRIELDVLAEHFPYELVPAYVQLDAQDPPPGELPEVVAFPPPSDGPHLSYAIQWFLFAVAASVTYAAVLRRRRPRVVDITTSA